MVVVTQLHVSTVVDLIVIDNDDGIGIDTVRT